MPQSIQKRMITRNFNKINLEIYLYVGLGALMELIYGVAKKQTQCLLAVIEYDFI